MSKAKDLSRFTEAQAKNYADAITEIQNGKKRSHWMWYVFPQIQGLGFSEFARYYAIADSEEARAYLDHPVLGKRLIEISKALLSLENNNATQVMGSPDDMKLKSSMTLFASLPATDPVFELVLQKFFGGIQDEKTLRILIQQ